MAVEDGAGAAAAAGGEVAGEASGAFGGDAGFEQEARRAAAVSTATRVRWVVRRILLLTKIRLHGLYASPFCIPETGALAKMLC